MTDDLIQRLRSGHHNLILTVLGGVKHDERCLEAADRIDALEKEIATILDANEGQARCIHLTAQNLGPDYSATVGALPKAAAHVAARAEKAEAEVARLRRTIEARDRRINRLVEALRDAQAKGYVTEAEKGPAVVLSDAALTAPADPQPPEKDDCDWTYQNACEDFPEETAAPADPQPVAQERTFTAPYSVEWYNGGAGKWLALKHNDLVFASYDVSRWGSEQACIEAAWQHVYAPYPEPDDDDWRKDPESDAAWCAGNQYALDRLCKVLKVDPDEINWDGSDGSLDEEADALIWRIIEAATPQPDATAAIRAAEMVVKCNDACAPGFSDAMDDLRNALAVLRPEGGE
jgi:hypothetical protein